MFDFSQTAFRYEPYPIGFTRNVLVGGQYQALSDSYPSIDKLRRRDSLGNKYILTEFDGDAYFSIVESHSTWRRFYDYVKSREFIVQMLGYLRDHNIDLGLHGVDVVDTSRLRPQFRQILERAKRRARQLVSLSSHSHMHLTSRFEFGAFPGNGGSQYPHTDAPRKVISLVLYMARDGEWDPAWGGGTAVVRPKDPTRSFNYVNKYLGFDDVEVLETFPFMPNCCVIFVKTFNSWHAVMPMNAPSDDVIRKTVVINIDLIGAIGTGSDY